MFDVKVNGISWFEASTVSSAAKRLGCDYMSSSTDPAKQIALKKSGPLIPIDDTGVGSDSEYFAEKILRSNFASDELKEEVRRYQDGEIDKLEVFYIHESLW